MCHPCVWIRSAILFAIPAAVLVLLWHLYGMWLFVIPAMIAAGIYVVKTVAGAGEKPRERLIYRNADSPALCLPCEREGKAVRATNVLAIENFGVKHEIPCCTPHLRIAESRVAISGGVNRGR